MHQQAVRPLAAEAARRILGRWRRRHQLRIPRALLPAGRRAALHRRPQQGRDGVPNRVVPDISYDADPFTGLKEGETLASLAAKGMRNSQSAERASVTPARRRRLADADQAAGGSLGFINPLLYRLDASGAAPGAIYDVLSQRPCRLMRASTTSTTTTKKKASSPPFARWATKARSFCGEGGECTEHKIKINAGPGYDSMTGVGSPGPEFHQGCVHAVAARAPRLGRATRCYAVADG